MSTSDLSIPQAVAFAIMYALDAESGDAWKTWAHGWLKGDDRGGVSAGRAEGAATTPAARHAAAAARLLDEASRLETEAAMLTSEGRNTRWHLDEGEARNNGCLAEVAEAIRLSGTAALDVESPRSIELRTRAVREF